MLLLDPTWVDTFTYTSTVLGVTFGICHVYAVFHLDLHRKVITRVIVYKAIFIFLVALSRLGMLIVAERRTEYLILFFLHCLLSFSLFGDSAPNCLFDIEKTEGRNSMRSVDYYLSFLV